MFKCVHAYSDVGVYSYLCGYEWTVDNKSLQSMCIYIYIYMMKVIGIKCGEGRTVQKLETRWKRLSMMLKIRRLQRLDFMRLIIKCLRCQYGKYVVLPSAYKGGYCDSGGCWGRLLWQAAHNMCTFVSGMLCGIAIKPCNHMQILPTKLSSSFPSSLFSSSRD